MTTPNDSNRGKTPAVAAQPRESAGRAVRKGRGRNKWQLGCVGILALILIAPLTKCSPPPSGVKPTPTPQVPEAETRQERTEHHASDQKRAEKTASKIKSLLDGEGRLSREDFEGQLAFWDEIVALAPDNARYAKERDRVQSEVDALAVFREHPELGGEVVKIVPRKAGFGAVMVIDITIRNRSLSHLKDFQIRCSNKGPSGTEINASNQTLYETVEARSTRTFRRVEMGFINPQTKSTNCQIEVASIA